MQTQRGDCFLYLRFIHSGWLRLFLVLFFFVVVVVVAAFVFFAALAAGAFFGLATILFVE